MTRPRETPAPDRHVEAVIAKLRARSAKGQAKYGCTTERSDMYHGDWLAHLQEELMDACVYLEAAIGPRYGYLAKPRRTK